MAKIVLETEPVIHLASDQCRMTFSMTGATAKLDVIKSPTAKSRTRSRAVKALRPSFEDELSAMGFAPIGDAVRVGEVSPKRVRKAPQTLNVTLDKPNGYYVIAVVRDDLKEAPEFVLPEPEVILEGSEEASSFRRDVRAPGARSKAPTVRVNFRIRASTSPRSRSRLAAKSPLTRVVNFFKIKIQKSIKALKRARKRLASSLAKFVDKKILKAPEGLKLVRPDMKLPKASKAQLKTMENESVLLFVHGIFSSIGGAFGDASKGINPPITDLADKYEQRVLGFDHWTVSKTTLQNARDLVAALPRGAKLNIVCHSRGGGVVRCLLEHPSVSATMKKKQLTVDTVVFVAGACLGSALAHPSSVNRLINGLNRLLGISGLSSLPIKAVAYLFKLLLHGIQELPGIEAMNPDAQIFKDLKKPNKTLARKYVYFRANYDPKNLPAHIGDEIVIDQRVFKGKANDVIVPFAGAGISQEYLTGGRVEKENPINYGSATKPSPAVWHTKFFEQPKVRRQLVKFV